MKRNDLGDKGREAFDRIEQELARRPHVPARQESAAAEPPPSPPPLVPGKPDFFAAVAKRMGADVPVPVPAAYAPPCVCGKPMPRRNEICAECSFKQRYERWREQLQKTIAPAIASFDPSGQMGWCRAGDQRYLNAVHEGRLAATDLPHGELRTRALRLLTEARWTPADKTVVLLGKTGLGKTMATIAIGHRLIDWSLTEANPIARSSDPEEVERARRHAALVAHATGMRFMTAAALVAEERAHPFGCGEPPLMRQAKQASLLVLDEVGRCRPEPIIELIFDRYAINRAPILMTGSVTLAEFESWLKPEALRRIKEAGHIIDLSQRAW